MLRRPIQVLLALIIALAAAVPVGVRAMPMSAAMSGTGIQHCPVCPQHRSTGANPDKMPACQVLACASAVATLPSPALLSERVPLHAAYLTVLPVRWTALARAPDPFPPRTIALV